MDIFFKSEENILLTKHVSFFLHGTHTVMYTTHTQLYLYCQVYHPHKHTHTVMYTTHKHTHTVLYSTTKTPTNTLSCIPHKIHHRHTHTVLYSTSILYHIRQFTLKPTVCAHTHTHTIGVNRPAFVGTVPHFHQMSREMRQMSRIFKKWYYYFLRCRLFYIFALERNKVTNKARFILRTPTDAVYISRVGAITADCLFCYAAGSINTATVTCHG